MLPLLADCLPLRLPASHPPVLLVVIDTEEEFDWNAPFDRKNTAVEAMSQAWRGQEVFDEFGIRPTWAVDYPVAMCERAIEALLEWVETGRGVVGAHLHPWVSPPFEEEVNSRNSYPGNLKPEIEAEKLRVLTALLGERLGRRPTIYKAGRYGFGPNTAQLLASEGYRVDLSPCAGFDFSADGGPDWSAFPPGPYRFGPGRELLGLPTTGGFSGLLAGAGARLHATLQQSPCAQLRLPGLFSRLGLFERSLLSPEGFEVEDLKRLTRSLLRRGNQVFSFSFHSPSLQPGCTPYVRNEADLKKFLGTCSEYFQFFFGELAGATMSPLELREMLQPTVPAPAPQTTPPPSTTP